MRDFILIGLDLEATDKKVAIDEITQIGIGFFYKDKKLEGFESFVKCNREISLEASLITGIYKKDLVYAPTFLEILPLVSQCIKETCEPLGDIDRILVAYNGKRFDIPLFVYELRRHGKDPTTYLRQWKITYLCDPFIIAKDCLDTTLLQQNERGQPNYKLSCVYEVFFQKPLKDAHSALADVNAMLELVTKCLLSHIEYDLINKPPKYLMNLLEVVQDIKIIKNSKRTISINTSMMKSLIKKYSKID